MEFALREHYYCPGYWRLTCSFNHAVEREYAVIKGFETQAVQSFMSVYQGWQNGAYTSEVTAFTAFETIANIYVSRYDEDDDSDD